MRKMASDLSKKRGLAKLRQEVCTTREKLLTSSGFKNKMRTLRRENKHKFREKWMHHKQTFMRITQQTYITKEKGEDQSNGSPLSFIYFIFFLGFFFFSSFFFLVAFL